MKGKVCRNMIDRESVINGLESCVISMTKCFYNRNEMCPYASVDVCHCEQELMRDALELLKEEQKFRKVMFNRCATATMRVMDKNACGMCIFREDCEKERTVNPW